MTRIPMLKAKYGKTYLGQTNSISREDYVWWDSQGMIMKYYFEYGKTVTDNTYVQQFKNSRQAIKAKRHDKLRSGVLLLQDNAPSQKSDVSSRVWL